MVYTTALAIGHGGPMPSSEQESVLKMIGKYLFPSTSNKGTSLAGRRGSVESCDEIERNSPKADMDLGPEDEERLLQRSMVGKIERCLSEAKRSVLRCQVLLLPRRMTTKVAGDVERSSAGEPCGLRGAFIMVYLEEEERKDGPVLMPLGVIRPDPTVTPTFELSVVLKADRDGWSPLRRVLVGEEVLKLRPEYRLVKRKLYSSENPVVHCFY